MATAADGSYEYDLVCIGSGPAGQRAAVQAAKLGNRAAVIERRRVVGGVCIDTGTIPSKTLREAVLAAVRVRRSTRDGLLGGQPPHPSAEGLLQRVQNVVQIESGVIEEQLYRNRVDLISGHASFVDSHRLHIDGPEGEREVTSRFILIAVGTHPTAPPGVVGDNDAIITSDGVLDLRQLPRTLTVVGGGVIGVEYASMFAQIGIRVTLIDRGEKLLDFLDEEIVDELMHQMRAMNVVFRLGEEVERLEVRDDSEQRAVLHLKSGKKIAAEKALYSIGRTGATDALNLEAVGLQADPRGRLEVDEQFRTAVPHIMAAGDVIGFPSLAATSSEQGRLAAAFAFGHETQPMAAHFPVGIYSIPEISMVGKPEHELTAEKVPYEFGLARYREIARGQILGDDTGLLKLLFHRESRQLLGVHAIGTHATELIHIGQAVLGLGGGLDYFLRTVFNYPTLAECYKVAALDASNKLDL